MLPVDFPYVGPSCDALRKLSFIFCDVVQCIFPSPSERYKRHNQNGCFIVGRLVCDDESETLLREKDSKNIRRVSACAVEAYSSFCCLRGFSNNSNTLKRRFWTNG